jgi:hypothetical protein
MLPAFQAAVDAVKAGAESVEVPRGNYKWAGNTSLDMTGTGQVRLIGAGPWNTFITSSATSVPAITIGGHATTRKSRISGIFLTTVVGTLPAAQVAGNYGIQVPDAGSGSGIEIRDCFIRGFANHGIRIAGPTGPTVIEDVQIEACAGYGIALASVGGVSPQDVSIVRGSIQAGWGGIYFGQDSTGGSVYDTDIELLTAATLPCVYIEGGSGGHSFHNLTASLGATPTPAAVIYIEGYGNTFTGGLNFAGVAVDNYLIVGIGAYNNTVIGGYHTNNGTTSSGYFAQITTGIKNVFISPYFLETNPTTGYQAGKGTVFNTFGVDNKTTYINGPATFGDVIVRGQPTPSTPTTVTTLTIANLLKGILTATPTATGATVAYTLPTGTDMSGGGIFSNDDSFDWSITNLAAAALDTITITANTDHTIVGNPIVQSAHATTGGIYGNSAVFRSRKISATVWVTYRLS